MARPIVICPVCRFKEEPSLWRGHNVIEYDWCYCCSFWVQWMAQRNDPRSVRVAGRHYWLLDDLDYRRRSYPYETIWEVEFLDGRLARYEHVQCQGAIPDRFREFLPTNVRELRMRNGDDVAVSRMTSSDLIAERPSAPVKKPEAQKLF